MGLLRAYPLGARRRGVWETAVPRQSRAGRPEEGEAANEPGGIINRAFERKLSFPKHMCEDLISLTSPGFHAVSPESIGSID